MSHQPLTDRFATIEPPDASWERNRTRQCFERDDRRIYPFDTAGFCISESGTWIPGCFETIEAAIAAFDVDDADLSRLQGEANAAAGPGPAVGLITLDALRSL